MPNLPRASLLGLGLLCLAFGIVLFGCLVDQTPVATIQVNDTQGFAPFAPASTFECYDPSGTLASCEMDLDGTPIAKGPDQASLFPANYSYPEFYYQTINTTGEHTYQITAVNKDGVNASANATFTVLENPTPTPTPEPPKPRPTALQSSFTSYACNGDNYGYCDLYRQAYCDKFDPKDLSVRVAASSAISAHTGAYSVNQLLDIYDWVRANVPYQNVPVDLSYQPYAPKETLLTKSGDCKNQAVLIASMVESIGGTARVVMIPQCQHAFAEVYVGNQSDLPVVSAAIYAHYGPNTPEVTTVSETGADDQWLIFDTAGGSVPGSTLPECAQATEQYYMYNCEHPLYLNPPQTKYVEYGPFPLVDKDYIIKPGRWWYFTYNLTGLDYAYCRYDLAFKSLSKPMNWYIIPETDYNAFANGQPYSSYYEEEQVQSGMHSVRLDKTDSMTVILQNPDAELPVTARVTFNNTCITG